MTSRINRSILCLLVCVGIGGDAVLRAEAPIGSVELLGTASFPFGTDFADTPVGGLSGITWDPELDRYYALSDDPSRKAASRFYTLAIAPRESGLDVEIEAVTTLTGRDGHPYDAMIIDGEGIALTPTRTLLISSEGNVKRGVPPSIRIVGLDGRELHEYRLPSRWLAREGEPRGVRHNQALEALSIFPDGDSFVTATENALLQDGPETDVGQESRVRVTRLDLRSGRILAEHVYVVDPVVAPPPADDAFRTNGLVEIVTLTETDYLSLERSFTMGVGNSIRLYLASTEGADDVSRFTSLAGQGDLRSVTKRLLVDLADLGIVLDNVEGMTLGPELADGRRMLALISDDNFSPLQRTQIFAFALGAGATPIGALQGATHRSPYEDHWITETRGIVTAIDRASRRPGFWIQDPGGDGDSRSSEGLFVATADSDSPVEVGDLVSVGGRVVEDGRPGELSVTRLAAHRIEVLASGRPVPGALPLGDDGLRIPEQLVQAIGLYEALEGMRISVEGATVVGPTTRFGTLTVALPGGDVERTARGGLRLRADDPNPERLVVDGSLVGGVPEAEVGRALAAPLEGVLDYAFGAYRLVATRPIELGPPAPHSLPDDLAVVDPDRLTVATFNVENLDLRDAQEKFDAVAGFLSYRAPDIVALQEIQDDSGTDDDGTVTAEGTLTRLVETVRSQGGPSYAFAQIDPENNADGGAPGGNIRVAFLYDTARASPVMVRSVLDGANPRRLFADSPAFAEHPERGFEATRKPLALELEVAGRRVVLVNVHLKSKRGDDRLFGPTQPPVPRTESQRLEQARELADWVDALLARDSDVWLILLGDFNEYEFRPPMRLLSDRGLINLLERVPAEERYTYNFEGNSQVLDHILVSPALDSCGPWIEIVHTSADFPHRRRPGDHDPVLASFDLVCSVD